VTFINHLRACLRDWTNYWHAASAKEFQRRFDLLTLDQQVYVAARLDDLRESMSDIQTVFQTVK
jgi:hypothetical protein